MGRLLRGSNGKQRQSRQGRHRTSPLPRASHAAAARSAGGRRAALTGQAIVVPPGERRPSPLGRSRRCRARTEATTRPGAVTRHASRRSKRAWSFIVLVQEGAAPGAALQEGSLIGGRTSSAPTVPSQRSRVTSRRLGQRGTTWASSRHTASGTTSSWLSGRKRRPGQPGGVRPVRPERLAVVCSDGPFPCAFSVPARRAQVGMGVALSLAS